MSKSKETARTNNYAKDHSFRFVNRT